MRHAFTFLVAVLLSVLPFACEEDYAGGGGLPGDVPRAQAEASASDSDRDRAEPREANAVVEDAASDVEDAD